MLELDLARRFPNEQGSNSKKQCLTATIKSYEVYQVYICRSRRPNSSKTSSPTPKGLVGPWSAHLNMRERAVLGFNRKHSRCISGARHGLERDQASVQQLLLPQTKRAMLDSRLDLRCHGPPRISDPDPLLRSTDTSMFEFGPRSASSQPQFALREALGKDSKGRREALVLQQAILSDVSQRTNFHAHVRGLGSPTQL